MDNFNSNKTNSNPNNLPVYNPEPANEPIIPEVISNNELVNQQTAYPNPSVEVVTTEANNTVTTEQNYPDQSIVYANNQYFDVANETQAPNQNIPKSKFNFKERWDKLQKIILKKWWLVLLVTSAIAVLFVGIFAFFVLNRGTEVVGSLNNVATKIDAPDSLSKGTPETWKVTIENREKTALQNVVVELEFDSNFEFIKSISPSPDRPQGDKYTIARLDANGEGIYQATIQFQGTTKGNIDEEIIVKGKTSYTPDSLIRLQNQGRLPAGQSTRKTVIIPESKTKTTAARISLQMSSREDSVQNNGEAEVTVLFRNTSEREIRDLRIRMSYPQGFTYTGSELRSDNFSSAKTQPDDGNNIWNVTSLQRLSEQTLKTRGTVFGAGGVGLTFRVDIEIRNGDNWQSIATTTRDVIIASKPLVVSTKIDGKGGASLFRPGETLNVVINYENQGTNILKNVEILGSIDDPADLLDWSTAQFTGGDRGNIDNKVIRWGGNNVPQLTNLGVKVKGELRYTIKAKENADFIKSTKNQNEYILIPQAKAQAQSLQQIQTPGEIVKAKGDLIFEQKVNLLPADPNQSNKRKYQVIWTFKSLQSQVNQVTIKTRTTLPTNAWDPSSITPAIRNNEISYNPSSGEIIWNTAKVPSLAGISNTPVSISFNLTVELPTGGGSGDIELFKTTTINGTDDFTGEKYDKSGDGSKVRF
jgi:hypothetical protein